MRAEASKHVHEIKDVLQTTCCIVGGGPAGAVLALLLARQGVAVRLLEAHGDFDREFRGDTIHPSVLTILNDVGLADRLLELPHTQMSDLSFQTPQGKVTLVDFRQIKSATKYAYIALIPQVKFLEFITQEASKYPEFQLVMGAQVDELIEEGGAISGVRYHGRDGWHEVRATLVIGADGRFSRIRKLAGFEPIKTSPPMDILWLQLSHKVGDPEMTFGRIKNQLIVAVLDRGTYWQIGYVIPKGHYQLVRAAGLEHLQQSLTDAVPELADRVQELQEWKQVSVLAVESSRVEKWYRPGLLLIGDAAHVMSPIGGVGINYAIQDATVAANVLGRRLKYGIVREKDLAKVQRQRLLPTIMIQALQNLVQKQVFANVLNAKTVSVMPPMLKFLLRIPVIRALPARIMAFGFWPVHVK